MISRYLEGLYKLFFKILPYDQMQMRRNLSFKTIVLMI